MAITIKGNAKILLNKQDITQLVKDKFKEEECRHESDGKLYDTIPEWPPVTFLQARAQYKCIKCGEFYKLF